MTTASAAQASPPQAPGASPAPTGHVYGYSRVSTVAKADEGESLEVQQRTIAYAQMHGLKIDNVLIERGVLGLKPLGDRPRARRCWPS
jgi:Resolvase, N terminal domain